MEVPEPSDACYPCEDRLTRRHWMLLLVLASVQFCHIVDFMIIVPLAPQLESSLGLTSHQFAGVVSAYGFAACAAALLLSPWLDRFDRKWSLLVLFAGLTAGTFLCAFAPGYWALLSGRIVAGAFGGVIGAAVLTIVGDAFPPGRRATATGTVMSAFSVASIVGVPAGLLLAEVSDLGWRAPFALLAGLCAGLFLLAVFAIPPIRGHLNGASRPMRFLAVLSHPAHLCAYALMFTLVCSSFTIAPFLPKYIVDNIGLSSSDLPLMYLCGGLATLVSVNVIGRLSDRYPRLLVFRICALAALVPLLLVTNLPRGTSLATLLVVTTFIFVLTSGRMVPAMAMITSTAEPAYRGSFMSINASVQLLGTGVAPLLAGALMPDARKEEPLVGYPLVGLVTATIGLVGIYLAGLLRPASPQEAPPISEEPEADLEPVVVPQPR